MASASMASTISAFFLDTSTSRHVHHTPDLRPPRPFAIIRRRLIQNVRVRENILKIVHVQRVLPRQPRQMSLHSRSRRRVPRAPRNLVDLRTKLRQRSSRDFLLRLSLSTHRLRRSRPTRLRSRARPRSRANPRRAFESPHVSVRRPFVAIPPRGVASPRRRRRARARTRPARSRVDPRALARRSTRSRGRRRALARPTPRAAPRRRQSVCESVRGRSNTRSTLSRDSSTARVSALNAIAEFDSAAPRARQCSASERAPRASAHRERAHGARDANDARRRDRARRSSARTKRESRPRLRINGRWKIASRSRA